MKDYIKKIRNLYKFVRKKFRINKFCFYSDNQRK